MPPQTILNERLYNHGLQGKQFQSPPEIVKWFGAVQAQDYPAAKWALGLRLAQTSEEEIDVLFNEGKILRTHIMRPTWHFVVPEDLEWMQKATSHRVKRLLSHYEKKLKINEGVVEKSHRVIQSALEGENFLTRNELVPFLKKAGVAATGMKLSLIVMRAELDALICSGPRKGKQFTYALVSERVRKTTKMTPGEGLEELIVRYFTSHGPATLTDFGWWSGLAQNEIKKKMNQVSDRLKHAEEGGKTYWFSKKMIPSHKNHPNVHLLPNYDEYTIAYKDTRTVFNPDQPHSLGKMNSIFNHAIVSEGKIIGMWKRKIDKKEILIQTTLFRELHSKEKNELRDAVKNYGKFFGLPAKLLPE